MPCARSSVGTASPPTALRDRERAPRSGRADGPSSATRIIRRGMRGYDVGVLQFLLRRHGIRPGGLDGRFGARTATAVRRFQRRAGLAPDGVVGPRTARRLCSQPACAWRGRGSAHIRVAPSGSVHAAIDFWSRTYGVDAHLVRAVALWESGYNNSLVSRHRRPGRHAGDPGDVGLRRDGSRRATDPSHGRAATSMSASPSSISCCASSAETSGSPSPLTCRAHGPSGGRASFGRLATTWPECSRSAAASRR